MKKIASIILSICMMISGVPAFAETSTYNDIENHWAKDVIENWSLYEIINGYEGKFSPDKNITRGEFATIINRIFKFDEPSKNIFDDLDENYYTNHILCLNNQGIMSGFGRRIRPNENITREEAGAIIYKVLRLKKQDSLVKYFYDENDISDWAKTYMNTLVNNGYFNGNNGYLRPKDNITRAEAVTLLDNCIVILNKNAENRKIDKTCIIACDNLMIKYCKFDTDVFVINNINNTSLENTSVDGTLYVLAKEEKDVILKNCTISNIDSKYQGAVFQQIQNDEEKEDISDNETETDYLEETDGGYGDGYAGDSSDTNSNSGNNSDDSSGQATDDNVVSEELKPTIETTLEDGLFQKNSKKVFDVFAKDKNGDKIDCSVRCNDINIEPSWDDETKTSFTLEFQESGEYAVEITATDAEGITQKKTYNITYEMAEYGEPIGKATVCIEAFTVGGGYIVAPIEIDVLEGINCAYILDEFLSNNNLSYMSTGSLDGGFYLATISDIPEFTPVICESLLVALTDAGFDAQLDSYTQGELSEFDFTQGSGWMYCVNGVFPNVGFSEYYLQDGDVMRIQFTLAYGSDIGGASGAGYAYAGDFYEIVNRDELTKIIASIGIENCQEHMELISKPDLTEDELSDLLNQFR